MTKNIITIFFLFSIQLFSQSFEYSGWIGNFEDASDFTFSPLGYIYITDAARNEIIKLDTNGVVHKTTGGYGWEKNSFDNPISIFSSGLNILVSDYNNHRIQLFDKDLNFVSSFGKRDLKETEESFGFPVSCLTNLQGDFFILDSENKRIIKYDLFGKFSHSFGSYDAGSYALSNPTKMTITPDGKIFIIDGKSIIVFDEFGNGISKKRLSFRLSDIKFSSGLLIFSSKENIYLNNVDEIPLDLNSFEFNNEIKSALMINDRLLILTHNTILIFQKIVRID
jgi:DNA-binding beta-propeller fold protein YncE